MSFCQRCGATLGGAAVCPSCGTVPDAPAPLPYAQPLPPPPAPLGGLPAQRPRPLGVTLVGIVLVAGSGLGAAGLLLFSLVGLAATSAEPWLGIFMAFFLVFAVVALLVLGVAIAVGLGLLKGQSWAWVGFLVLAGLGLLGSLAGFAGMLPHLDPGTLFGVLVWGGVGYYFLRPEVREYFRIGTR